MEGVNGQKNTNEENRVRKTKQEELKLNIMQLQEGT